MFNKMMTLRYFRFNNIIVVTFTIQSAIIILSRSLGREAATGLT